MRSCPEPLCGMSTVLLLTASLSTSSWLYVRWRKSFKYLWKVKHEDLLLSIFETLNRASRPWHNSTYSPGRYGQFLSALFKSHSCRSIQGWSCSTHRSSQWFVWCLICSPYGAYTHTYAAKPSWPLFHLSSANVASTEPQSLSISLLECSL